MHPEAMRIISYAKKKGFIVSINTNFTLVTEDIARYLVENKVDHLIVSLWAGTPDVYAQTHPNKTEETFYEIKSCLQFLNRYKRRRENVPCIKIYNVVFNMNYQNFPSMIDFVVATESEAVEFTLIDTIPGKTDKLLLSEKQAEELLFMAKKLKEQFDNENNTICLENYETFLRRLSSSCQGNGEYDRDIMQTIPCYAGWTFARIVATGDVNSCLKSHRIPIGNLHKETFRSLWNSARQQEFRRKTRRFDIHDPYFRLIGNDTNAAVGCFRSCDNIGHSLLLHNKITRLNKPVKAILKTMAAVGRTRNSLSTRN
ncbi:MAG: SPASM domain-containing protein [Candidatus Omnitrophica bacterium]|nr:SPASM domain-containing protein [Candidatus Omnitrophota bacterium]